MTRFIGTGLAVRPVVARLDYGERVEYRRIYLMADYDSSSLWTDEPSHFMVSAERLPLTRGTADALAAWSAQCWEFLEHDEDAAWRAEQAPLHDAEGVRLWRVVRQELGDEYEVGFAVFDAANPVSPGSGTKRIVWDPADLDRP